MLFESRPRSDTRPRRRTEPIYDFLDRSGRPDFEFIRSLMESWFTDYPESHRDDLRSRFISRDDRVHESAVFELFLYEMLLRLGLDVKVHPVVDGIASRPDFLVTSHQERFFLEATVVNPRDGLFAADPLEDKVLDAIDDLDSPNFRLWIDTRGRLTRAPPYRSVVQPFLTLMESNDPDDVQQMIDNNGLSSAPSVSAARGSWSITGILIPKGQGRGDASERTIGIGPSRGGLVDSATPVRQAMVDKGNKYKNLGAPLVVAVNAVGLDDRIDELEVLFGKEQVTFDADAPTSQPRVSRKPDGVWLSGGFRPRYTRLSAALLFRGVAPWSVREIPGCLYVNPYCAEDPPASLLRLPHAIVRDGQVEWSGGLVSIGELIGIPDDWRSPPS